MTPLVAAVLLSSVAAPVPKEKPDPLPDGALVRLGSARFRGPNTDGVTFSNDGKTLYASYMYTVFRWDAETGKPFDPIKLGEWKEGTAFPESRVFGDRAFIPSDTTDQTRGEPVPVRVFDLPSGKEVSTFDKPYLSFYLPDASRPGQSAAASADGRRHAAVERKEGWVQVTVHDPDTGKVAGEFSLPKDEAKPSVHLSADGKRVTVGRQKHAVVYAVGEEKELFTVPGYFTQIDTSPDGAVQAGAKAGDDGGLLALARPGLEHSLLAWDAKTGKQLHALPVTGQVWHLRFAGNDAALVGHTASTTGVRKGVRLSRWNLKTGKLDWTVPVAFQSGYNDTTVYDSLQRGNSTGWLAVSPDGKRVAVSNRASVMAVYDAATGKRLDENSAHCETIRWAGFSPDGKTVTTLTERDIRVWEVETGKLVSETAPAELVRSEFAGATKTHFVWFDRSSEIIRPQVFAWDRAKGKLGWKRDPMVGSVSRVLTAGDTVLAVGEKGVGQLATAGYRLGGRPDKAPAFGRKRVLAAGGTVFLHDQYRANTVTGYAVKDWSKTVTVDFFPDDPKALAPECVASPDGDLLAVRGPKYNAWAVADATTGEVLRRGEFGRASWYPHGFSDDGKLLVGVEHQTGTVHLREWREKEKGKAWELKGEGTSPTAVAFSPDGKRAVVGYRDGTAIIWDVSK